MTPIEGLYLSFAVICEKVLHEVDGVFSFVRVIDKVTISSPSPTATEAPSEIPLPAAIPLTIAVGFKSSGYYGPVPIKISLETPTGLTVTGYEATPSILENDRGVNVIISLQFPVQDEGTYSFIVEISGEPVTRVPLQVEKQAPPRAEPSQGAMDVEIWDSRSGNLLLSTSHLSEALNWAFNLWQREGEEALSTLSVGDDEDRWVVAGQELRQLLLARLWGSPSPYVTSTGDRYVAGGELRLQAA